MTLIHHVVAGQGVPPIVFVHGFGCALADWDAQMAYFSPRHQTVAVDLRGHGQSPGTVVECSLECYAADLVEVMRALRLPPAVLVGHSMGCRVVTEAARQAPEHTAALVQIDGSQFAPAMAAILQQRFAEPQGLARMVNEMFNDMFTAKSDKAGVTSIIDRASRLPQPIAQSLLTDMQRYDVERLPEALSTLRVPVMALQTTYTNEKRERRSMSAGQTTPYLDMLRAHVSSLRIEVIPDTGHFPQLDDVERTNGLIDSFIAGVDRAN